MVVGGVGLIQPETHLQRVQRGLEIGQHHITPCGTGRIHIQGLAATRVVVVAGGGVGVAGGVVGLFIPALGQRVDSRAGPGVEALAERHRIGPAAGVEGDVGRTGNAAGTVGGDIQVIVGVGGQADEVDYGVVDIGGGASAEGETGRSQLHGPAGGIAYLLPSDVGGGTGDTDNFQIVNSRAVGYVLHRQFVEVGIAVFAVGRHDGYAGSANGVDIAVHRYGELLPRGGGRVLHRVHGDEGGLVVLIGDYAHDEAVVVGGVGLIQPETQLQRVDRGYKFGQHHIAPCGIGRIHIHGLAATGIVVVAGGGIRIVGRIVGLFIPAVGQRVGSSGGPRVEPLVERHGRTSTMGTESDFGGHIGVGAERHHTHHIVTVGLETGDGVIGSGDRHGSIGPGGVRRQTIVHIPGGLLIARNPRDGDIGGMDAVDSNAGSGTVERLQTGAAAVAASGQAHIGAPVGGRGRGRGHIG